MSMDWDDSKHIGKLLFGFTSDRGYVWIDWLAWVLAAWVLHTCEYLSP
jgi:hypothetical protein